MGRSKNGGVRGHILLLAAMHPELKMAPEVQEFVTTFQQQHPGTWREAQSPNRDVADGWDARIRLIDDQTALQQEMDSLAEQFSSAEQASVLEQYAFTPAHPKPIAYLTANFLHGGWLHLIENMWFLWLAGAILEDTWGRAHLSHGLLSCLGRGTAISRLAEPRQPCSHSRRLRRRSCTHGRVPGAVSENENRSGPGPWTCSLTNLALGKGIRFKAAAYWLLPLWLLMEIFSGALFGAHSGVAHWAHVGGFVFGALAALGLRYSGLEHKVNEAIEAKVTWTADREIVEATGLMEKGNLDEAIGTL